MKNTRQNKILELIKTHDVENQKQLQDMLIAGGFDITQATVSRDIKELRLIKALAPGGNYRYISASSPQDREIKLSAMFVDAVISIGRGQNVVCVKCAGGMAQAICAAMDALEPREESFLKGSVGTLAGEDTIFILCCDNASAEQLRQDLTEMMRKG